MNDNFLKTMRQISGIIPGSQQTNGNVDVASAISNVIPRTPTTTERVSSSVSGAIPTGTPKTAKEKTQALMDSYDQTYQRARENFVSMLNGDKKNLPDFKKMSPAEIFDFFLQGVMMAFATPAIKSESIQPKPSEGIPSTSLSQNTSLYTPPIGRSTADSLRSNL